MSKKGTSPISVSWVVSAFHKNGTEEAGDISVTVNGKCGIADLSAAVADAVLVARTAVSGKEPAPAEQA